MTVGVVSEKSKNNRSKRHSTHVNKKEEATTTVSDLQQSLFQTLLAHIRHQNNMSAAVIGIYSRTPCTHCGHALLDEETVAMLLFHSNEWPKPITANVKQYQHNHQHKRNTYSCPFCHYSFILKLHI